MALWLHGEGIEIWRDEPEQKEEGAHARDEERQVATPAAAAPVSKIDSTTKPVSAVCERRRMPKRSTRLALVTDASAISRRSSRKPGESRRPGDEVSTNTCWALLNSS